MMNPEFWKLGMPRAMQGYQLMRVGSAVLTGILLAKSQLSTADIGTWEALLFIGSFVIFTGVNGLLQGITPVYMPESESDRKVFLFNVVLVFVGIGTGVFLLFLFLKSFLISLFTGLPYLLGFEWFALYLLLHIPSLPVEIIYLVQRKPYSILGWGMVGFGLQMLAVFIPAYLGWGLTGCLQMMCLLAGGRLLWTIYLLRQYATATWNTRLIKTFLRLSAPMAANSFTGNLIVFFDNWLVGHWFMNPAIFALFRYGSREFPLTMALSTALGTAMVPVISADNAAGMAELKQRNTRLMHVVMPITLVLLLTANWLFPVLFNPHFADAAPLFQIYLLVALSRVLLPNSILLALGDTRVIFKVGIAELALKIILGVIFIWWWGLPGVAWSVVLANWFEKIALALYLRQKHNIPVQQWLDIRVYAIYAAILVSGECLVVGGEW
jgi:O-antigen/teichoic acid export membrane protein